MNKLTFLTDHAKQLVLKAIEGEKSYYRVMGYGSDHAKQILEELNLLTTRVTNDVALTSKEIKLTIEAVEVEIIFRTKLADEKDEEYTYPGYEEDIELLRRTSSILRTIQRIHECLQLDNLIK